ncbi:MAG: c-type cytochrome [Acidobacteria bacterium]|nr:c-type cytochrome [Acidobacteriota bacterium]
MRIFKSSWFVAFSCLALLPALGATAAQDAGRQAADSWTPPAWAYPVMDEGRGRGPDDGTLHSVEGSDLQLTQTQINDRFAPPDWYPDEHPPMPDVVAHGRPPLVRACAQCHMPHGAGHPESSSLAGLPADYITAQTMAYQDGSRKSLVAARSASMIEISAAMTEEEMRIAAEYFASLPPVKWITVIETDMVPETYVGAGNMRHAEPGGGMEPIGNRIIEIPENSELAELRDSHSPFMAYVPRGSVAAGEELATTGGGRTIQCSVCHGPELKGVAQIPSIAGRSPIYLARQMFDIKHGVRDGANVALMKGAVANLTDEDILNLSAYLASLEP